MAGLNGRHYHNDIIRHCRPIPGIFRFADCLLCQRPLAKPVERFNGVPLKRWKCRKSIGNFLIISNIKNISPNRVQFLINLRMPTMNADNECRTMAAAFLPACKRIVRLDAFALQTLQAAIEFWQHC